MNRWPVQLAIEVDDANEPGDTYDYPTDVITLVAYVGGERHEIASTTEMTGYQATNDPAQLVRLLLTDALGAPG